jgi:phosphoserine phosphatase
VCGDKKVVSVFVRFTGTTKPIQTEVIDELAELLEWVIKYYHRAMNGELDFSESFKQRMALLEGLSEEVLHKVATNLPITKGTHLDACAKILWL